MINFDLDLWPRPFKNEPLPDLNVAINPWKFHQNWSITFWVMLHTDKQRNKQTDKQTNKQINAGKNIYLLAEVNKWLKQRKFPKERYKTIIILLYKGGEQVYSIEDIDQFIETENQQTEEVSHYIYLSQQTALSDLFEIGAIYYSKYHAKVKMKFAKQKLHKYVLSHIWIQNITQLKSRCEINKWHIQRRNDWKHKQFQTENSKIKAILVCKFGEDLKITHYTFVHIKILDWWKRMIKRYMRERTQKTGRYYVSACLIIINELCK